MNIDHFFCSWVSFDKSGQLSRAVRALSLTMARRGDFGIARCIVAVPLLKIQVQAQQMGGGLVFLSTATQRATKRGFRFGRFGGDGTSGLTPGVMFLFDFNQMSISKGNIQVIIW